MELPDTRFRAISLAIVIVGLARLPGLLLPAGVAGRHGCGRSLSGQLVLSERLADGFDDSLAVQRAALDVARETLQEVRERNEKIPPPTGGGIVPGADRPPPG